MPISYFSETQMFNLNPEMWTKFYSQKIMNFDEIFIEILLKIVNFDAILMVLFIVKLLNFFRQPDGSEGSSYGWSGSMSPDGSS